MYLRNIYVFLYIEIMMWFKVKKTGLRGEGFKKINYLVCQGETRTQDVQNMHTLVIVKKTQLQCGMGEARTLDLQIT